MILALPPPLRALWSQMQVNARIPYNISAVDRRSIVLWPFDNIPERRSGFGNGRGELQDCPAEPSGCELSGLATADEQTELKSFQVYTRKTVLHCRQTV